MTVAQSDRAAHTQATVDRWRGKVFAWGMADCGRLVASHVALFGHNPGLARFGAYKSALGARRALKRQGFDTMTDALDAHPSLVRCVSPAFARVGDILALPHDPDDKVAGALVIYLGNGAVLGFHPDGGGAGVAACCVQTDITDVRGGWHV